MTLVRDDHDEAYDDDRDDIELLVSAVATQRSLTSAAVSDGTQSVYRAAKLDSDTFSLQMRNGLPSYYPCPSLFQARHR